MPYLIQSKQSKNYRVFLFSNRVRIGRGEGNDILLKENDDLRVSRRHARIDETDGAFVLTDTSTNGTLVEGRRVDRFEMQHGTSFEIADYRFTFVDNRAVERIERAGREDPAGEGPDPGEDETLDAGGEELDSVGALKASLYLDGIVVESDIMVALYQDILAVAGINVPVLIRGEPGTGKEKVAWTLHRCSRAPGKFVPLNCSAIPETLFESELFGSVKGAFSNAPDKAGKLELAHRGTILLDEIGDMNLPIQPKLLRFLEDKLVSRLGDNRTRPVDVRVVAASNQDLGAMTRAGTFREDLYHRLACIQLDIPPLRKRKEEIPALTGFFLKQFASKHHWEAPAVSGAAMKLLMEWDWPGNVRELMNVLLSGSIQARGKRLRPEHLSAIEREAGAGRTASDSAFPAMTDLEKGHILDALEKTGGNKRKASMKLGISRDTLYRKMKKYNIPI
ncbi:MAG: sigma 54-interacting transcriptional regulator [Deltaproteobacteria bacterium]|nr:sigma 54-interacting transcriptional regulator [Deltaproteobacteria bacterium]